MPLLKDLYQYITPQYAVYWRVIGTLLGLPSATLDIIEYDNPHRASQCCNAMLSQWLLAENISSTWENLFTAIESPTVLVCMKDSDKGYSYVYTVNMYTYVRTYISLPTICINN